MKKNYNGTGQNSLRNDCQLLVAGGTIAPRLILKVFLTLSTLWLLGKAKKTLVELTEHVEQGLQFGSVRGLVLQKGWRHSFLLVKRGFIEKLGCGAFSKPRPLRQPIIQKPTTVNDSVYTTTPIISSRGCPFSCDFLQSTRFLVKTYVCVPQKILWQKLMK